MSYTITPSFLNFPSLRRFPLWDEDDDMQISASAQNGLSISEDKEHIYIEASVPGVDAKDVEVTYHKGLVWIKAETKEEESNKDKKYYRKALRSFSYRVAVPGDVDQTKEPKASVKNGVMTVVFSKIPQEQPKKIRIEG